MMDDVERLRKFLAKNELFKLCIDLPGDIVELGVFKGIGFMQLLKMLEIYSPGTNKKVIGFDLFNETFLGKGKKCYVPRKHRNILYINTCLCIIYLLVSNKQVFLKL